jgi:secreted trypsin-like serine protease
MRRLLLVPAVVLAGLLAPALAHASSAPLKLDPLNTLTSSQMTPFIVGGTNATGSFPSQAFVETSIGGDEYEDCGGTLVAARYILTAAHCITNPYTGAIAVPADVETQIGNPNMAALTQADIYQVSGVWRDPSFDPSTLQNDAAVLELSRPSPLPQTRIVGTGDSSLWAAGVQATIIGWGLTDPNGTTVPTQLQETQVEMRSDSDCAAALNPLFDPATMVCAGEPNAPSPCHGDSGGPLLVPDYSWEGDQYATAGIVSWGVACGGPYPNAYTRVGGVAVNSWLQTVIPGVNITAAAAVAGQPFTLTANPHGPAGYSNYAWDLTGDGNYTDATGQTVSATMTAGEHVVAVQATDAAGDDETAKLLVTVAAAPSHTTTTTKPGKTSKPKSGRAYRPAILDVKLHGRHAITVRVRVHAKGTVYIEGVDHHKHVLVYGLKHVKRAGVVTVTLPMRKAGIRESVHGRMSVKLTATYSGKGHYVASTRKLTARR